MFWSSRNRQNWPPKSTGNAPHTGQHLNSNSNHPPHVKRGLIQSIHNRTSALCQEQQDLVIEISNLRRDFQLNGYPQSSVDSVTNFKGSSHLNKEQKPLGSVYIPYVKGVSEKFKRIRNLYNNRTIFRTRHALGVHSWKPGHAEIRNRRHSASIASPVNAAEATLAKHSDL
jgi:hypothetical protein